MTQEKFTSRIAVYPGSFDPITNGHVDIINRGVRIFDEVIVLVAYNASKTSLFTVEERVAMISDAIGDIPGVRVDSYSGLLVDYLKKTNANVILRGMRALSDFEYEFQMALMNRRQSREIETVFLMSGFKWFFTGSQIIKQVASIGGSVKGLLPDKVHKKLLAKFNNGRK
ncbi:MAG: pantetheine-phosphate adenylyltransferase [Deltaproteobacteria bacterium HGW-Deltaproteobacteria-10]|nr:MAG: pantetheine-phosphate adenylyltransferase [Deltaproteobacteria bacterium HGW-Deltaproteobacteria-10]